MILVNASHEITDVTANPLEKIERAGRKCYKSEDLITETSAEAFIRMLVKRGHHAVLEHAGMTVDFVCDRGVTHELVRHRLAAYCQESTRYCNYGKSKFGSQCTFVVPCWFRDPKMTILPREYESLGAFFQVNQDPDWTNSEREELEDWATALFEDEQRYMRMLKRGWQPQQARYILPNGLKTEIVMTANMREWRHVFSLRANPKAHPSMVELMKPLANHCLETWPALFEDVVGVKRPTVDPGIELVKIKKLLKRLSGKIGDTVLEQEILDMLAA